MTALGEVGTRTEVTPNSGVKIIQVVTDATVDDGDTMTVDLTKYGARNIHGILGFIETTTGSVVVAEQPTTAVSAGVLTITVGGSTDNKVRSYTIFAY
jgi:hypothetical protein